MEYPYNRIIVAIKKNRVDLYVLMGEDVHDILLTESQVADQCIDM